MPVEADALPQHLQAVLADLVKAEARALVVVPPGDAHQLNLSALQQHGAHHTRVTSPSRTHPHQPFVSMPRPTGSSRAAPCFPCRPKLKPPKPQCSIADATLMRAIRNNTRPTHTQTHHGDDQGSTYNRPIR